MPTYEYRCEKCGHEFERMESISAKPSRKCVKCGRNRARRLISGGAGLIFKGTGFYCTDYGKRGEDSKKESPKKEAPGKAADE